MNYDPTQETKFTTSFMPPHQKMEGGGYSFCSVFLSLFVHLSAKKTFNIEHV